MALFAISDLHLCLGEPDKSMEVFKGWSDYIYRIEKNWNAVVSENDTVVIGGDVSWAMKIKDTVPDFEFVNSRLNGNKIILKGNHDLWWDTASKMTSFFEEQGFDKLSLLHNNYHKYNDIALCGTRGWFFEEGAGDKKLLNREAGRLELSITSALRDGCSEIVVFLHYPPVYSDQICNKIVDVLDKYSIKKVYYGHIHGSGAHKAVRGEKNGRNYVLMSCDSNDFTPLLITK